ncbi:MAG: endonuclease/exonuclease/phosphatase family protein [Bacteroidota bacterium]
MNKTFKIVLRSLGILVGLFVIYLVAVIGYAMIYDFDPPASMVSEIETASQNARTLAPNDSTLTLLSWNIGFMGLGAESDFFYDGGEMVYMPEEIVNKNREGVLGQIAQWEDEIDFFLLQEVDRASKRSHYQDEYAAIGKELELFSASFGTNYRVDYIPIPLLEPLGKVWSGVATYSRKQAAEAIRYSFKGNYDWPTYLFFLDRCFLLNRYPLDTERDLVVINTHNSAYDDGSLKQQQMKQLKAVLLEEYAKGNAVIVGGDWNQFPPDFEGVAGFELKESERAARYFVPKDYPAAGWQWAADHRIPTNRSLAAPLNPDTTSRYVIDYFLLSPNVSLVQVEGMDLGFQYSDHQPVKITVAIP